MTIIILYQTIAVKKVLEPLLGEGIPAKNASLNLHLTATDFNECELLLLLQNTYFWVNFRKQREGI